MERKTSFYNSQELKKIGLKKYGNSVLISRKASIYSPEKISLGNNVRIDDFTILSGSITIGSYVHIAAYVALYGKKGIILEDYTSLSPHAIIFSASDDFSGNYLANPVIPEKYTNVWGGEVIIRKYVLVGAGSIVLPCVKIGEGAGIGAMSLVNRNLEGWKIYTGVPVRFIKNRSKALLEKEKELLSEEKKRFKK